MISARIERPANGMKAVTHHETARLELQAAIRVEADLYRILEILRHRVPGLKAGTKTHFNATRLVADAQARYRRQRDRVGALSRQAGVL